MELAYPKYVELGEAPALTRENFSRGVMTPVSTE